MRTLQNALECMLNSAGSVSLDFITESLVQRAKPLPMQEFQRQTLYLWYDYFSCPQLEHEIEIKDTQEQGKAIMSIPAYIARCCFFFALCPVLDCPFESTVLTAATWSPLGGGGRCCSLVWWRGNQPGINSSPPGALVAVPH